MSDDPHGACDRARNADRDVRAAIPRCACSRSASTTCSCRTWSRVRAICARTGSGRGRVSRRRMRPNDWTFCTYRGHVTPSLAACSMTGCMGEFWVAATACWTVRAVRCISARPRNTRWDPTRSSARTCCIAIGAGWTAQYKRTEQVAVCFFGDGATNIGAFHEAINLAAVWKLPVVFVCENNLYMEYTPIDSVTAVKRPAADRAASYGLPCDP